jgi:hypothetical protein
LYSPGASPGHEKLVAFGPSSTDFRLSEIRKPCSFVELSTHVTNTVFESVDLAHGALGAAGGPAVALDGVVADAKAEQFSPAVLYAQMT